MNNGAQFDSFGELAVCRKRMRFLASYVSFSSSFVLVLFIDRRCRKLSSKSVSTSTAVGCHP